ncbi:hypothetical protein ACIHAA_04710 [Streptomyces sp. NPDC052040]|uniref:amino acid kinase family protein n=1 Tax=Streptomyces sp. NPDC052040 TaxID=3365682 RepID=UPI0037D8C879
MSAELAEALRPDEPRTLVLKVGGSLVSDKQSDDDLDESALRDYAAQIADLARAYPGRVVFVAGGGALGHGAVRDLAERNPDAVLPLTQATFRVKWAWTKAFQAAGQRAMPLQVAALCTEDDNGVSAQTAVVSRLLSEHILPVLSGDCVVTTDGRLRIMGSDHVPGIFVAADLAPVRVVTLTDVPGILTGPAHDSPVLPHLFPDEHVSARDLLWAPAPWDTSDAMHGKLDALVAHARRGAECVIAKGDRDAPDLRHLFSPLALWPQGIPCTVISRRARRTDREGHGDHVRPLPSPPPDTDRRAGR